MQTSNQCQTCSSSPWVKRAHRYVATNTGSSTLTAHVSTIRFLLSNGNCGLSNRVPIAHILNHLKTQGFHFSRESFQNSVLTQLKRAGVISTLVYPGPQGGVFIPCNATEIDYVIGQVLGRVVQELTNLEGSAMGSKNVAKIRRLRNRATACKGSI